MGDQDCAFGLVNIFLKDSAGHIYGRDRSAFFAVDNAGDAPPSVALVRDPRIVLQMPFTEDTLTILFRAADPERDTLHLSVSYSVDHGDTYAQVESFMMPSDSVLHSRVLQIGPLANSNRAVLHVTASNASGSGFDKTSVFVKRSQRQSGPEADRTRGFGGKVTVNIVDPTQLTGNLYRAVITDSTGGKWYDVFNVDTGLKTVRQALVPFDGVTEGPLFDGIRLLVKDYAHAEADIAGSRWEIGSSTYQFSISLPVIDMGGYILTGVAYPADYGITLSSTVVDTSSAAIFGAERVPMRFEVRNITENRRAEVVYLDGDANGELSRLDEIYILEPDSLGNPQLTWGLLLQGSPAKPAPAAGDMFTFRTFKPIRSGDTFEFRGTIVSVARADLPPTFRLDQNYPNPFNPSTTISFVVGRTGPALLQVYNILGQHVRTLFDGAAIAGETYLITFDASRLASGVYFYRMTAGSFIQARKMLLVK